MFVLREAVDNIVSAQLQTAIHAHIKRRLLTETEPSFSRVQLMRRNPQIQKNAINFCYV